jgi:hypothetical protein
MAGCNDYRGKVYLDSHNDEQAMNDFEHAITLGVIWRTPTTDFGIARKMSTDPGMA